MATRYRRKGFYDEKIKAWKTYYISGEGKIVFDKGKKNYNDVKKEIRKNNKHDFKTDIINKKASKHFNEPIKIKVKQQKEVDTLLKKKKLTKLEKEKLKDLSEKGNYKKDLAIKKAKIKQTIEIENYLKFNINCTYGKTTSSYFFIAQDDFNYIQPKIKKFLKKYDRCNVIIDGMETTLDRENFNSIDELDHVLSEMISGYSTTSFYRGKALLEIRIIKR